MTLPAARALLVGLGNPGAAYAGNRHNIGFMAVDRIAATHGFAPFRRRFHGECAEGSLGGRPCFAFKPMTFMNLSGQAVGELNRFYKIATADVICFHDDLDIAEGRLRVKQGGGNAGHNGLKSLDAHIGPGFWRVRLGIGHPGVRERVHGHVLSDFATADRLWLDALLDAVARFAPLLVAGNAAEFTSRVALALAPPKPPAGANGSQRGNGEKPETGGPDGGRR